MTRSLLAVLGISLALACGGGATSDAGAPTGPTGGTSKQLTHPGGTLSGKIALAAGPTGISIADNGTTYVTQLYDQSIARFPIDASAATQEAIPIGPDALDVVLNHAGTTAYVAGGGGIKIIDVASGTVKSTVSLGANAYEVELSPDESRLYASSGKSSVWSIPTAGGTPSSLQLTSQMYGLGLSPSGAALYAAGINGVLWRLDPTTLSIVGRVVVTGPELGDVAVSPDGAQVYVVHDAGLFVLDGTTLATLGFLNVGPGASGMAMTPDGAQLYITTIFGKLTIVDRAKRTIVSQLTLGGVPRHVAFDKLGKTALVANEDGWVDVIK
jgi:DNA-binding beta-propeller fold protein YncE